MNKRQTIDDSKHTCDSFCYDEEIVNKIKPKIEQINGVEQIFKALADPTRLKIAYALTIEKELCVCDVAHIIGALVPRLLIIYVYYEIWTLRKVKKRESSFFIL